MLVCWKEKFPESWMPSLLAAQDQLRSVRHGEVGALDGGWERRGVLQAQRGAIGDRIAGGCAIAPIWDEAAIQGVGATRDVERSVACLDLPAAAGGVDRRAVELNRFRRRGLAPERRGS